MEERKILHFYCADNGISISEEGDKLFTAHITKNRHVNISKGKKFTRENMQLIYNMAHAGNIINSNNSTFGYLVLNPIRKPTKEYINETGEVFQLSVETVKGKQYVCTPDGKVLSDNPESFRDIPQIYNPENKKYMLTDYTKEYDGHTLYRIRALKDFAGKKAGELGGFVEGEHNLSQYGNCWIQQDSMVFNIAHIGDNALVTKSIIYGNAKALENSRVIQSIMYGDAIIKDCAIANNAYIYHKSIISGESRVSGHLAFKGIIKDKVSINGPYVKVTGKDIELSGEVQLSDYVEIDEYAKVRGKSRIMGHSRITDYAEIFGNEVLIKDNVYVGGKSRIWDKVILYGNVKVNGRALIRENAQLSDHVEVADAVEICGNAKIKDNVMVCGCCMITDNCKVSGNALITDYAQLYSHVNIRGNAQIAGHTRLKDNVCVTEDAKITGNVILSGDTIIKGKTIISTQEQANKFFKPAFISTCKEIENNL